MRHRLVQAWLKEHTPLEPLLLEGSGSDPLLAERIAAVAEGSEARYVELLKRNDEELDRVASSIAVPETWFFRYPQSFKYLAEFLGGRRDAGSVTIASVGCAAGEEPLSIAMTALHAGLPPAAIRIEAIDQSSTALRRAESGVYGPASIRTEIPAWAAVFMQHGDRGVRVDPEVRRLVRFSRGDATASGTLSMVPRFDVIFCRNLMIYLSEAARARLLDTLTQSLAPDGLLFVGHAEPLLCTQSGLRPVEAAQAFCLRRARSAATPPVTQSDAPRPLRTGVVSKPVVPPRPSVTQQRSVAITVEPDLAAARELADAGRMRECETLIRDLSARGEPSAEALELLGMTRMSVDDIDAARTCFEQSLYLDPDRAAAILQLAMIHEKSGDLRRADVYWQRARRIADRLRGETAT